MRTHKPQKVSSIDLCGENSALTKVCTSKMQFFRALNMQTYAYEKNFLFEVAAVKEWLDSNQTFHIMRDHPSHNGR